MTHMLPRKILYQSEIVTLSFIFVSKYQSVSNFISIPLEQWAVLSFESLQERQLWSQTDGWTENSSIDLGIDWHILRLVL